MGWRRVDVTLSCSSLDPVARRPARNARWPRPIDVLAFQPPSSARPRDAGIGPCHDRRSPRACPRTFGRAASCRAVGFRAFSAHGCGTVLMPGVAAVTDPPCRTPGAAWNRIQGHAGFRFRVSTTVSPLRVLIGTYLVLNLPAFIAASACCDFTGLVLLRRVISFLGDVSAVVPWVAVEVVPTAVLIRVSTTRSCPLAAVAQMRSAGPCSWIPGRRRPRFRNRR